MPPAPPSACSCSISCPTVSKPSGRDGTEEFGFTSSAVVPKWWCWWKQKSLSAPAAPSLDNDVFCSVSAPGDTWLSEHIPLRAVHAPPTLRDATVLRPFAATALLVLRCPFPLLPRAAVSRDSALSLHPCVSSYACVFILLLAVTFVRSPRPFPGSQQRGVLSDRQTGCCA